MPTGTTSSQAIAADIPQPQAQDRGGETAALRRRDDFDRDVWCLLGLPIDIADIDRTVAEIDASVRDGEKLSFVTPNVNWLVRSLREPAARREILNADFSVVDGAPLVLMARALGLPVKGRVAGADIFEALRRRPGYAGRRLKVFFFGGRDGAAEAAVKALDAENGGVEAVGWHNPGFGDVAEMSTPEIIEKINAAGPDFIVVALGAAKGQAWIDFNKDRLDAPVISHLGAVVDFTAGGVARAPDAVKRLGLEWAWRIKEEPTLWRRYYNDARALASIALTRFAPQFLNARRSGGGKATASARVTPVSGGVTVNLGGAAIRSNLADIRRAFRTAAAQGGDVVLDITAVQGFDLAFLGLVLMLEKHVATKGGTLYLDGASPAQKSILKMNAIEYPESAAEQPQTAEQAIAV